MNADFTLRILDQKPLLIKSDLPVGLEDYHIPGSAVFSSQGSFGKFLLQKIEVDGFTFIYNVLDIDEDVSVFVHYSKPLALCHINLSGTAEHDVKQAGILVSRQSQFNVLFCPNLFCNSFFKKGFRYISIDIVYPPAFILQSLAFYPFLEKFHQDMRLSISSLIPHREMFLDAGMVDKVYHLIHSPFSQNVKTFHLNLFRELLYDMLKAASSVYTKRDKFFIHQLENIYVAKEFIDSHLSEHFTIPQIAKKAGLNEQRLKKGFKEIFGKGLFEYLLTERLTIARIQLEETFKPVKEIARLAGYRSPGNFSIAFKKKFGEAPLKWRRLHKK